MNQRIKNLNYSDLLFFDIETVRGSKDFDERHPFFDVWAWKQRNRDTNEIPDTKEVIETYYSKAGLYAEWGKIVCISVGYISEEELIIKSFTGEESEILNNFINLVKNTGRKLVGHNIIGFDLPFTRKRYLINGLGEYLSEKQGNDVGAKPWTLADALVDTMDLWKGTAFLNTSLDELAMVFGIPTSKDEMQGNMVSDYYYDGRIEDIKNCCQKDVAVVANVIRRWKGDGILEPIIREEVKTEKLTPQEKLLKSGVLTEELLEEFKSKGKITKTEKERLKKILIASITEAKSLKAVKEEKEKEVEQFLNNL